jgi:UrcA family protein
MRNPQMSSKKLVILASALAMLGSSLAMADTDEAGRLVQQVKYSDLNLSNQEGAATLYRRLSVAAAHVCAPLRNSVLAAARKHSACVDQAMARAVADVNAPALTEYFTARGGDITKAVVVASIR